LNELQEVNLGKITQNVGRETKLEKIPELQTGKSTQHLHPNELTILKKLQQVIHTTKNTKNLNLKMMRHSLVAIPVTGKNSNQNYLPPISFAPNQQNNSNV
jgi:hypothetical protein